METHNFKTGDKVNVINQTLDGRFIVEGRAAIVSAYNSAPDMYRVRFDGNGCDYPRYVDPDAQGTDAEVSAYIDNLNNRQSVERLLNGIRAADVHSLPGIVSEAFHIYMSHPDNEGVTAVLAAMEEGEGDSSRGAMDAFRAHFDRSEGAE